jgi:hypothetical protein
LSGTGKHEKRILGCENDFVPRGGESLFALHELLDFRLAGKKILEFWF